MKRLAILTILTPLLLLGAARDIRDSSQHAVGPVADHTLNFDEAVAMGRVPNAFVVHKFGYNSDVDATEESIWDVQDLGGPARCFTNPSAAAAMYVSSDSASDTGTISIEHLDANYEKTVTTYTLSGLTFVPIGTYLRVNRAYAVSAAFVGNIYIHTDPTDTVVDGIPDNPATELVAGITLGENQTLQACYTVPAGHKALLKHGCVTNSGSGTTQITFRRRIQIDGGPPRAQSKVTVSDEGAECRVTVPDAVLTEHTDVEFTGSGATDQDAAALFDMVVLPN
jgi:hypothetical protein